MIVTLQNDLIVVKLTNMAPRRENRVARFLNEQVDRWEKGSENFSFRFILELPNVFAFLENRKSKLAE